MNKGSPDDFGHPKLFCHVLLERILEELGLNTFFSSYKGFTKMKYPVNQFHLLLLFLLVKLFEILPLPFGLPRHTLLFVGLIFSFEVFEPCLQRFALLRH